MALDNVGVPVPLLVKARVEGLEKLKPIVDRSTLFPLSAWDKRFSLSS
jgi:hypothetical protein